MDITTAIKLKFTYEGSSGVFKWRPPHRGRKLAFPFTGSPDGSGYLRSTVMVGAVQIQVYAHRAAWVFFTGLPL